LARLTFSNVPTKTGGVVSGNISTGAGSPFGKGGQFASQVADIKATIAKAPKGTYDPQYWDQFLELDPEEFPEGSFDQFIPSDDPEILSALYDIPTARLALQELANQPTWNPRWSNAQRKAIAQAKRDHETTIALHVNRLMMEKNAPLIQAVKEQQRQKEIDQAVQLAMEQKIRETATLTPEPTPTAPAVTSSFPIIPIIIIAVIVGFFLLRRRA
jgi:hypothetical protein